MTLEILTVPNKILKEKAKKIGLIDKSIKKIIDEMIKTLEQAGGIGLAAPQIKKLLRIIIIESHGQPSEVKPEEKRPVIPLTILVNPEIVEHSQEKETDTEGCLSVPNIWGDVSRYKKVIAKGLDQNGKKIKIKANDLFARVLQHEIDHLDGILFTDKVTDISTLHTIDEEGQKIPINLPKL